MEEFTFKFRGKTYRLTDKWEETCVNDSKAFQIEQFKYLNKVRDYVTMKNRINNQIILGYLEEVSYIK
jgi:hypothetical protein